MNREEFLKYIRKSDVVSSLTDLGIKKKFKNFRFICSKCGSFEVLVETEFNYNQGSELTGIWGQEVKLLLKCKDCGNAESIVE